MLIRYTIFFILTLQAAVLQGQDSAKASLTTLSPKYLEQVSKKTDKYYSQVTTKTEKTLERLSHWENKIKTILEKTSPETAQRLFGNNQLTFAAALQKYKEGKAAADNYRGQYDAYRDKLVTTVKYLNQQKNQLDSSANKSLQQAKENTTKLEEKLKNTEATAQFIKERKKQLLEGAMQIIGKSKYLAKISKSSYYYLETLKNYRDIFSTPGKAEQTALTLLQKIPAFENFFRRNSILSSLFRMPGDPNASTAQASLAGLQTRAQVNNLIQQQIAAGGPGAQQQFQQNLQAAQSQLNELKNKILKAGGGSSDADMPEGFRPNSQRAKTFGQKLEYSMNIQTDKGSSIYPVGSNIGASIGFRPSDKFIGGLEFAGRIGWGKDISHIALSYSGISARSFLEYKIRGSLSAAVGFEMNYRPEIHRIELLKDYSAWSKSCLVGVSKVVSLKTKLFKKTSVKLLWDVLSNRQTPKQTPLIFRVGYNF